VAKSDLAKAATSRYDFLTLEQAAAVAEFDDDPEAVKAHIVAAQQDHGFLHLVQQLRDERKERIARQPIIDELVAASVKIIDRPRWADPAKRLEQLGTSDDPLTSEAHASCDGHVAWIDEEWIETHDDDADYVDEDGDNFNLTYIAVSGCSDPVAYGHIEATAATSRNSRNGTQTSDQEAKAERQRVLRNNKAWRAAEVVRREWLKAFVARKSAPKGAQRFIFSELVIGGCCRRTG
jgi:ParB family transcriptional regulator, chromosome partitioning protein